MPKLLSLLLLSLTLLTVACKKDDPKAEPALLGRWESQQFISYEYSATGQLLSQKTTPDMTYYMVITSDSLNFQSRSDGNSWGRHTYSRQGNVIRFGQGNVTSTITELTDHTLTLRYNNTSNSAPNTPYFDIEEKYTR